MINSIFGEVIPKSLLFVRLLNKPLLVISEIALTLMLLAGAGLLARSFWQLQQIKPGFQPEKLLTLQIEFPWYRYRAETMVNSFVRLLSENLPTLPGVESVGSSSGLPFTGSGMFSYFSIEGRPNIDENTDEDSPFDAISPPPPPGGASSGPNIRPLMGFNSQVSPGYFRTMGVPLRRGREFDPHDDEHSPPVVIINEAMAQRYWPGEDPLGKRIKMGGAFHPMDDNCRRSWERQALCIGRKDEAVVLPAIPANR